MHFADCDGNTPSQQDQLIYNLFYYLHSAVLLSGAQSYGIVDSDSGSDSGSESGTKLFGIATWFPPGVSFNPGLVMMLRSGMWRFAYLFGRETRRRFLSEYAGNSAHNKKQILGTRKVWYLMFLAVVPEAQGHGHGKTLLKMFLDRADAAHEPSYLESSTRLVAERVYSKHEFVVKGVLAAPDGISYEQPCMLREART